VTVSLELTFASKIEFGRGDETVDLMKDDLHILRYKPVRSLLESSKIELI
jgi:hypothetical protein